MIPKRWYSRLIFNLWYILEQLYFDRDLALTKYLDQFREDHPAVGPALRVAKAELAFGRGNISILYHQYFSRTNSYLEGLSVAKLKKMVTCCSYQSRIVT